MKLVRKSTQLQKSRYLVLLVYYSFTIMFSNFDTSQADPELILEVGFAISHTHIQVMTPDHHITFTILHFSFFKESILDLLALSISISKPKTKVYFLRFNHLKIILMC